MKQVKYVFLLAICFAAGVGISKVLYRVFEKDPIKAVSRTGVGDPPPMHGFSLPPNAPPTPLNSFGTHRATAIGLHYPMNPETVKRAHELRLKVVLLPPVVFAEKNPYPAPLAQVAAEAQEAGVDALCVSWLNTDPDAAYWKQEIETVRGAFHGQIILAGTQQVLVALDDFNSPDVLGIVGPLRIPTRLAHANDTLTLEDVRSQFQATLNQFESLARAHGKKLALLDMFIPATSPTKLYSPPGRNDPLYAPQVNPAHQQVLYEAFLTETKGRNDATSMILLNWNAATENPPESINQLPTVLEKVASFWQPSAPAATSKTPAATAEKPDQDDLP